MPAANSTARPKNRDQKKATQLLKDIKTLKAKLRKQLGNGVTTSVLTCVCRLKLRTVV
jgi:hypothetical protein